MTSGPAQASVAAEGPKPEPAAGNLPKAHDPAAEGEAAAERRSRAAQGAVSFTTAEKAIRSRPSSSSWP